MPEVLPASVGKDRPLRAWLVWLTAIACLPPTGLNVMVALDADMQHGLGLSASAVQAAVSLYALGLAFGQPLAGIAADRWGRRPTLLAGLLLGFCGACLSAMADGAFALLSGRILNGLGFAVVLVVPRATLRDLSSGPTLQRGLAIISGAFALAPAVAPLAGWALLSAGGWRAALGVVPVLAIAGFAMAMWRHAETRPAGTSMPDLAGLMVLWRARQPRLVALGFAAISSIFFLLIALVPAAVRSSVAMSPGEISLLLGGTYLGFLGGNVAAAAWAGRITGLRICAWGAAAAGFGVCLIVLCLWQPSVPLWVLALLLYSIGHGLVFPAAMGVVMQAMPERAGMAAALAGMMQMLAGAIVSGIAVLLPGDPTQRIAAVAVLMLMCGIAALVAANESSNERKVNETMG